MLSLCDMVHGHLIDVAWTVLSSFMRHAPAVPSVFIVEAADITGVGYDTFQHIQLLTRGLVTAFASQGACRCSLAEHAREEASCCHPIMAAADPAQVLAELSAAAAASKTSLQAERCLLQGMAAPGAHQQCCGGLAAYV